MHTYLVLFILILCLRRFKLCILAGDDTGNVDFILFGRQAQRLTRKAADTLIAENPIGFIPDELTKLLERTFKWTVSFTDSTTDSGNITFQVNTVVGEVTQEGDVLPATPAGSQASSIMLSPGAGTTMQETPNQGTSLALSLLPEASHASTTTPTKATLSVSEIPDSPLSVKKSTDHQVHFSFWLSNFTCHFTTEQPSMTLSTQPCNFFGRRNPLLMVVILHRSLLQRKGYTYSACIFALLLSAIPIHAIVGPVHHLAKRSQRSCSLLKRLGITMSAAARMVALLVRKGTALQVSCLPVALVRKVVGYLLLARLSRLKCNSWQDK